MKGTRATTTTTMDRTRRKKSMLRETAPGCDIMFTPNETEVGVSEVKAAGYYKLLTSRVERQVLYRRVEVVMNFSQVYHLDLRDDSVERDVCIPESALRAR